MGRLQTLYLKNILWVAEDGSYGTCPIAIHDTTLWSEADWKTFDQNSDSPMLIAHEITSRIEESRG